MPWELWLVLPLFLCVWCAVCLMVAWAGGWSRLARSYRAAGKPAGRSFWMQSARIGWVDYNGCLTIRVSQDGLYLSVWPLLRLAHPPLLLPWSALQVLAVRDRWWSRAVTLAVGTPPQARLRLPLHVVDAARDLGQAVDSNPEPS
jgi:hypothetical protein